MREHASELIGEIGREAQSIALVFNMLMLFIRLIDVQTTDSDLNSGKEFNLGGLDWANSDGHQIGQVVTSFKVVGCIPVSLKSGDVCVDLPLVESVVLGDRGGQSSGVREDLSPSLNGCDVVTHVLAGAENLRDLQGHQAELKSGLSVIVPASILDVSNASLNLLHHEVTSVVAGLNLCQVVVTGHAVNESSDEIGCIHNAEIGNGCGLNRSDSHGHQSGQVVTSLEEVACIPISLKSADVSLDLLLVESVVLGKSGRQLGWVSEDLSPSLDGCDVTIHVLAGAKRLRNLQCRQTELKSSLSVIVPATLLDVCNASINLLVHEFAALEARLDLSQVIITSHSIDETSNEVSGVRSNAVLCVDTANHSLFSFIK